MVRVTRNRWRVLWFFQKIGDPHRLVDMHHAKRRRLHPGHGQAADGHVGPRLHVLAQHQFVVHLVDMVTGQDDRILDTVTVDDVDILRHGVGGAAIPVHLIHPLAGGQDVEVFVPLRTKEVPAALAVADQAVCLVLCRDCHFAHAGIQRVGQCEVDDPGLATEIDCWFGTRIRQFLQPAAAPPGQHKGHRLRRQTRIRFRLHHRPLPIGGACRFRRTQSCCRYTADSGGSVTSADCAWPCQGVFSVATPPRLPRLPPP